MMNAFDKHLTFTFLEKLTLAKNFGVQLVTKYSLGRKKSVFIQFLHIHDVVITEVIQNVRLLRCHLLMSHLHLSSGRIVPPSISLGRCNSTPN